MDAEVMGVCAVMSLVGSALGLFSGLAPGIHVNTLASMMLAAQTSLVGALSGIMDGDIVPLAVSCCIMSASVVHSFTDFVPSVFIGAPDGEDAVSVLPGHRLLLQGRGMEAVRAAAIGSLIGASASILLSIPLQWALDEGFAKIAVITTREKGFRKKLPSQRMINLYDDFYGDNALFLATMLTQETRYNALMDELDALEEAGRIFVLRPAQPVDIGRFEGDMDKLLALYNRGRREMRERLGDLRAYLEA